MKAIMKYWHYRGNIVDISDWSQIHEEVQPCGAHRCDPYRCQFSQQNVRIE